jgi:transposase-like protein
VPIFSGASRGAVVAVVCPWCKELQARARIPEDDPYECRACGRSFTRTDGERAAEAKAPPDDAGTT